MTTSIPLSPETWNWIAINVTIMVLAVPLISGIVGILVFLLRSAWKENKNLTHYLVEAQKLQTDAQKEHNAAIIDVLETQHGREKETVAALRDASEVASALNLLVRRSLKEEAYRHQELKNLLGRYVDSNATLFQPPTVHDESPDFLDEG